MGENVEKLLQDMAEQSLVMTNELKQQSAAANAQVATSQAQIAALLGAIQQKPQVGGPINVAVNQPAPDADVIRADKLQRIALGLRKSNRVKVFNHTKDSNIRIYIKKFDEEVRSLKTMVGIDNDLIDREYVPLLRNNLDFHVLKRVEQAFKADPQALKSWDIITIAELHTLLINEFGEKQTDIANVLSQFGPSRVQKVPEKSVSEFYFDWYTQIPDIMKPATPDDCIKFADLILRAMFFCL